MAIAEILQKYGVPGATVGISRNGTHEIQAFGVASMRSGYPTLPESLFRVASITKPVTATMILHLAEQGKISLDQTVGSILDLDQTPISAGPRAWQDAITIRHLLSHTSGLDCEVSTNLMELGMGPNAMRSALPQYAGLLQFAKPGVTMSYANTGYWLIGQLVEHITGQTFEDVMRSELFEPLQMTSTCYEAEEAILQPVALPHKPVKVHAIEHTPIPSFAYPRARRASGGVISNAADLLNFADWHNGINVPGPEIAPDSLRPMYKPLARLRKSNSDEWAVGFALRTAQDGTQLVGHGGSFIGYETILTLVPARKFALSILTNSAQGSRAIREIEQEILEAELSLQLEADQPVSLRNAELDRFVGTWEQPLTRIEISRTDSGLRAVMSSHDPGDATRIHSELLELTPLSDTDFIAEDGPMKGTRVDFEIDPETGELDFARLGLRIARRVRH